MAKKFNLLLSQELLETLKEIFPNKLPSIKDKTIEEIGKEVLIRQGQQEVINRIEIELNRQAG